ncbi:hypothetical protein B0H13DRAFT_1722462, partial [Mycena leptocephala]
MRVLNDPADPDPTPRFDLLEIWKETLEKEKPEWDVAWQPMSDGRDKRMTVRFPDAAFKKARDDKTPCTTLEKVKAALTAQGMIITDSYSTVSTGSYLTLANHAHVDSLISDGYISVPAVSPNSITVTRCRQIECLHAFEIVISGIAEGEGAQSSICRWISKQIRDPIDNSSCLVDARVPENEADCLVVWMSDWNATSRLLATGDAFDAFFKPKIPSIHRPQLLLAFNNEGLYRPKTVTETFKAGADSMNESLKSLQAEIAEIRRETRAQHAATQLSVAALTNSVTTLHTEIEHMSTRVSNQASAFLAMATENTARSQLAQCEMVILQWRTTLRFGDDSEKEEAKAELAKLKIQAAKLTQSLNASAGRPVALLGGSIGRVMPVPIVPPGIHSPSVPSGSQNVRDEVQIDVPNKRARHRPDEEPPTESNMMESVSSRAYHPFRTLIATREVDSLKKSVTRSTTTRVISRVSPSRVFHAVTNPSLRGRLLAIDIILPTDSGLGFVHRIMGIYAPWDPGINNIDPFAREFWADVTAFCQNTTTSWTMAGDVNATVVAMER